MDELDYLNDNSVLEDLDRLRDEIDDIDKQMVKLFEKRMNIVLKVGEIKEKNDIPILNQDRECEVIDKNISYISNKYFANYAKDLLNSIMRISRDIQKEYRNYKDINTYIEKENKYDKDCINMKNTILSNNNTFVVGFQSVEGSFSQQALVEYFGEDINTKCVSDFEEVFKALSDNEINYGVLPIENSSTGAITEIYDLLRAYGFYIVGEKCIKVEQNLLVTKGTDIEDIKEVYSHPQGFKQSNKFLKMHPNWKLIPYKNTAMSAELIKNENLKSKAAIGSKKASELYDLEMLKTNINFNQKNITRFIVIGKELEVKADCNKVSIIFSLSHKPKTLFNILKYFSKNDLNLLKIESRPIIDKPWEYFFYIDFEGYLKNDIIKETIDLIKDNSLYFKLLGNYKSFESNIIKDS